MTVIATDRITPIGYDVASSFLMREYNDANCNEREYNPVGINSS